MSIFYLILRTRLYAITQRVRKIDVVQLGKLFDEILDVVPKEKQAVVVSLMDEFVRELE